MEIKQKEVVDIRKQVFQEKSVDCAEFINILWENKIKKS